MARLIAKKATTTVTEEVEILPPEPGEDLGHRFMTVGRYGTYRGTDGHEVEKP